jgi:hypothetical protein
MRRARKPLPPALWQLQFNPRSGFYEIREEGITYKMQLEETRSLKDYFRDFRTNGGVHYPTVAGWHLDLSNQTRKKVVREGNIKPGENDGFYPDISYE